MWQAIAVLFCLFDGLAKCDTSSQEPHQKDPRVPFHGNWCGPNHGGFQNCCGGRPCPSCTIPERGDFRYKMNMTACFAECPPTDTLDAACVWHDACTFVSGEACGHYVSAESCFCNCVMASVCHGPAQNSVICSYFEEIASCWFCMDEDEEEEEEEEEDQSESITKRSLELRCDQLGSYQYPLNYFCSDGVSVLGQFFESGGQLHMEQDMWNHSCFIAEHNRSLVPSGTTKLHLNTA